MDHVLLTLIPIQSKSLPHFGDVNRREAALTEVHVKLGSYTIELIHLTRVLSCLTLEALQEEVFFPLRMLHHHYP